MNTDIKKFKYLIDSLNSHHLITFMNDGTYSDPEPIRKLALDLSNRLPSIFVTDISNLSDSDMIQVLTDELKPFVKTYPI